MTVVPLTKQSPTITESWSPEEKLRHSDLSTIRDAQRGDREAMRARRNVYVGEVQESAHDNLQADIHRSHELQSALDQLPEAQREILILRHFVGLTPGEIAIRLNRTEASVHGLHHRGPGSASGPTGGVRRGSGLRPESPQAVGRG